jgi:alpha,alpha-trehalase
MESERGTEFLPTLDRAEEALREQLQSINGALVERKKFSIAIHYRSVKEDDIGEIEKAVDRILIKHPKLRKSRGKKIFELQPDIDWHKGKALLWLIDTLELDRSNTLPFYIGDDTTDEDAFNTLRGLGFGIVILEGSRCTAATYSLKNPDEVEAFLKSLASMLEEESQ